MTKAELVEAVYRRLGFSKKDSAELVDSVLESAKVALESGEPLKISGFGSFRVREKRSRIGRNPETGRMMVISQRRVVTFKASQVLKDALNAPQQG